MFELYEPTQEELDILTGLWQAVYYPRYRRLQQEQYNYMYEVITQAALNGMILEREFVRLKLEKCLTSE